MKKNLRILLLGLVIVACSSDSQAEGEEEQKDLPFEVTVIYSEEEHEFQLDVHKNGTMAAPIDLTNELGLPSGPYIKILDDLVTYSTRIPETSFWQKNMTTNEILVEAPFCTALGTQQSNFVSNSLNYSVALIVIGDYTGEGWDSYANVYSYQDDECHYISLGLGEFTGAAIYNETLLVLGRGATGGNTKIDFVDLGTMQVYDSLDKEFYYATVIDGLLYLFTSPSVYEVRNLATLELQTTVNMEFSLNLGTKFFDPNRAGTKIEFQVGYPQPSPIANGPGIFDISSGDAIRNNLVLFDVRQNLLEQVDDFNGTLPTYALDVANEIIVVGFSRTNPSGTSDLGGIVFTDFEGNIMDVVELEHVPRNIVIKD